MSSQPTNRPKTTSSWLFEELRAEVIAGKYPAGSAITQEEIASRYEVSRMPVREVFRLLEAEGLVESRPHKGIVVTELDIDDAVELFEIRAALEVVAIRRSFPKLSDEHIRDIADAHATLTGSSAGDSTEEHRKFHMSLYAAAGNRLRRLVSEQLDSAQRYHLRFGRSKMAVTKTDRDEHLALLRAAEKRDSVTAAKILKQHLTRGAREIAKSIKSHKGVAKTP